MWLATCQRIEGSADVNVDVSRGAHSFRPTRKGYITDCRTSCYRAGWHGWRVRYTSRPPPMYQHIGPSLGQGFTASRLRLALDPATGPPLYTLYREGEFANPITQKVLDKLLLIEGPSILLRASPPLCPASVLSSLRSPSAWISPFASGRQVPKFLTEA